MRIRSVLIAGQHHDVRLTPQTDKVAILAELIPFGQHESFYKWLILPNDRGEYKHIVEMLSEHVYRITLNGQSLACQRDLDALQSQLLQAFETSRQNYLDQRVFPGT